MGFVRIYRENLKNDPVTPVDPGVQNNDMWTIGEQILTMGARGVKLTTDSIIFTMFVKVVRIFRHIKLQKLLKFGKDERTFHSLVFYWTLFVAFLNLYRSIYFFVNVFFLFSNTATP